ncbi:MAG: ABC transporter substrate-binding protein [Rhodospirillaceae bacterium]|nr:ABC transporter substrate-binding protein [Rhodospirillaceae bacterium]
MTGSNGIFSRRALGAVALALAIAVPGVGVKAETKPIAVRFTVQPNTLVTTLVEVAVERGFFKEVGIDASTVTVAHGPAAVTALASGTVDVATNAPEVFMALAGKGQSVKLIAGQTKQLGVLVARPGLTLPAAFPESVRSLKGKKIGVTALSSATQYLAITMIAAGGLSADEVSFVAVGTGATQALVNSVVDAGFVTGPQVVISQSLGAKVIVDLRTTDNCPPAMKICGIGQVGMWAMGDWIGKNAEAVARIRKAIAKADMFMHDPANADAARAIMLRQIPAKSADKIKQDFIAYGLSVLSAAFAKSDLERWIEIDHKAGVIKKMMPVATVFADGTPESADAVKALAK